MKDGNVGKRWKNVGKSCLAQKSIPGQIIQISDCNGESPILAPFITNTQIQSRIHKYKVVYTNTKSFTQIQSRIHKYKFKLTNPIPDKSFNSGNGE